MLHAHADVRLGFGAHAHFSGGLDAEEAGQVVIMEHLRPSAVSQNHHFADQHVDGRTAFAEDDGYFAFLIQFDAVIVLRRAVGFVFAACFLQGDGELVEPNQVLMMGEHHFAGFVQAGFGVEMRLDGLDAQVFGNVDGFDFAGRLADVELAVHIEINADGRTVRACIETERGNPVFGQHGDFSAGEIDRAQAFHDVFFHFVAWFNGKRRRGDVDADALHAVAQIGQA